MLLLKCLLKGYGEEEEEELEVEDNTISEGRLIVDIELERYKLMKSLTVEFEDGTPSDALAWWKMQEKLLPVLSVIARRLLCLPVTSAPSERVFSVAGLTISKNRTAVQP
jgi:hAT family C-terminal dimerisation region